MDFFFNFFFNFSLLYHLSFLVDVFNGSFWKMYIKTINDSDPGLNLLEIIQYTPHATEAKTMHRFLFMKKT